MHEEYKVETEITIFRDCREKYYTTSQKDLTHEEFIKYLEDKKPAVVHRATTVISYSLDRTKLAIKRFYHLKEYKLIPNKTKLKAIITKQIFGITIDLKRHNVFSYTRGNLRGGGNWCRTNNFNNSLHKLANSLVSVVPNDRSFEFYQIIKDELGLNLVTNNIAELVRAYYFNKRKIDYFNNDLYLAAFCRYFSPNKNAYDGLNIFQITNIMMGIKNPEYVPYFYGKLKDSIAKNSLQEVYATINLYNLKLCDEYGVALSMVDEMRIITYETDVSIPAINNFYVLLNKVRLYYKISLEELTDGRRDDVYHKLVFLKMLQRFGYTLNIENLKSFERVNRKLLALFACLYDTFNATGAFIIDPKSMKAIKKYFGDKYVVQPGFDPNDIKANLSSDVYNHEDNGLSYAFATYVTAFSYTYITIKHKRKSNPERYRVCLCDLRSLSSTTNVDDPKYHIIKEKDRTILDKKIRTFGNYFTSDCKNIRTNFDFKYVFSEKHFIDLCEKNKINYKKYITKL